ncbi:hypothetical protein GCM10010466_04370 [Planomonospora alba]|uniref:Uncharacterized protein n=1 Tax=Planomonospora alba TaxID=161354 RepID=A0ABP6MJB7_9ACTN
MATIQIRDIPDGVCLTYKERAMRARQSSQEYPLGELVADARQPSLEEILERAEAGAVDTASPEDIPSEPARGRSQK